MILPQYTANVAKANHEGNLIPFPEQLMKVYKVLFVIPETLEIWATQRSMHFSGHFLCTNRTISVDSLQEPGHGNAIQHKFP